MTQQKTQPFISTIEKDRDLAIGKIKEETDVAIKLIFSKAHAQALELQQTTNECLRNELSLRKHKEVSRIQSVIRAKRWEGLKLLQDSISQKVLDRMQSAWGEPEWQWDWCHFWLQVRLEQNDVEPIAISITESVLPQTLEKIEQWADQNKRTLSIEEPLPEPGLKMQWADFELDGSISAQNLAIDDAVLAELTPLLPRLQRIYES